MGPSSRSCGCWRSQDSRFVQHSAAPESPGQVSSFHSCSWRWHSSKAEYCPIQRDFLFFFFQGEFLQDSVSSLEMRQIWFGSNWLWNEARHSPLKSGTDCPGLHSLSPICWSRWSFAPQMRDAKFLSLSKGTGKIPGGSRELGIFSFPFCWRLLSPLLASWWDKMILFEGFWGTFRIHKGKFPSFTGRRRWCQLPWKAWKGEAGGCSFSSVTIPAPGDFSQSGFSSEKRDFCCSAAVLWYLRNPWEIPDGIHYKYMWIIIVLAALRSTFVSHPPFWCWMNSELSNLDGRSRV